MTPELSRRLSPGVQIWEAEGLAARWGFDSARLGYAETGMLMDDDAAGRLPLPSKDALLDYARRTFAAPQASGPPSGTRAHSECGLEREISITTLPYGVSVTSCEARCRMPPSRSEASKTTIRPRTGDVTV